MNSHPGRLQRLGLKPRKKPVQARSTATVQVIFAATIQVLLDIGAERLTTTRVAERAGVSVGTLYQYFPNKHALLAEMLELNMADVMASTEAAFAAVKGQPLDRIAATIVSAFLDAKLQDAAACKALEGIAAELGGAQIIERMLLRFRVALCDVLATATDATFTDLKTVSLVLSTALGGTVQLFLGAGTSLALADDLRRHLVAMAQGYLRQTSQCVDTRLSAGSSLGR